VPNVLATETATATGTLHTSSGDNVGGPDRKGLLLILLQDNISKAVQTAYTRSNTSRAGGVLGVLGVLGDMGHGGVLGTLNAWFATPLPACVAVAMMQRVLWGWIRGLSRKMGDVVTSTPCFGRSNCQR